MTEKPSNNAEDLEIEKIENIDSGVLELIEEDVEKEDENKDEDAKLKPFDLVIYPADTKLEGYMDNWDKGLLDIPKFQRKYVWDRKKASRFIESILLGLPVPSVFLYQKKNATENIIIDGQQRILTVISFIKGRFINIETDSMGEAVKPKDSKFDGPIFSLKGTGGVWEGMKYADLDDSSKFRFDNYIIRATIIQQLDPDGDSSMFHIFERLNTGGVFLNAMEVRMALGAGEFTKLLKRLNKLEEWGKLLGRKDVSKTDLRLRDLELILRFFALEEWGEEYVPPMKKALHDYIIKYREADEDWLKIKEELFKKTVNKALLLDENPFKNVETSRKFSVPAFESIMVGLASSKTSDKDFIRRAYDELQDNEEYQAYAGEGKGTTNMVSVRRRITLAKEVFGND